MKTLWKMIWTELKLQLREPVGVFFTLAFPLMLLFIFGSIYGNEPSDYLGGHGSIDISVPGYIGMIIGTIGMLSLPIALSTYREQGILRRLQATPLPSSIILWSQVAVNVIMTLLGASMLVIAGFVVYDLSVPQASLGLLLAVILSGFSFLAVGFVLAGVLPTARSAQAVGMALFYPMLFLSGAAMPRQVMPEGVQKFSELLPLTHVVKLLEGLWLDGVWNQTSLAVVVGLLMVCLVISRRTFRWE
ncbi:MAG: ABC transporter permease [Chloroflexi bacterium]|jgi:ABC-2 type transport system permease protein|nr:ABC transporter permease [Chloroflexota bacterium]MBK6710823.1 ABC transporter permease [Chloroflexota bacterium]MBK7915488.1 ABC transporter permease [Chloroflexota bacterium]MBK8933953.1 ABC transporter permease [Chloroflexota bacterium]